MAILLNENIATNNTLAYTHEDVFGRGGYVAVTTGLPSPTATAINAQVPAARVKLGMLVHDNTSGYYFRCSNAGTTPPQWTQVFNVALSEQYVEIGDLPQNPPGVIDLASQTSVDALASSVVRVRPDNTIQTLVAGAGITLTPSYSSRTITIGISSNLDGGLPGSGE